MKTNSERNDMLGDKYILLNNNIKKKLVERANAGHGSL
jgi:hypothetical protein